MSFLSYEEFNKRKFKNISEEIFDRLVAIAEMHILAFSSQSANAIVIDKLEDIPNSEIVKDAICYQVAFLYDYGWDYSASGLQGEGDTSLKINDNARITLLNYFKKEGFKKYFAFGKYE